MTSKISDHERVASSGAWLGFGLGVGALGILDTHMPHVCAFLLNWTFVLAACYFIAVWKRAWYAWVAFWGMAVLCPVGGIMELAGALSSQWSIGAWLLGCAMCFVWYWLIRMPRLQAAVQAVERHEVHVIHHVIHHGQEIPGWSAAPVAAPSRKVIPAVAAKVIEPTRRAIEPARRAHNAVSGLLARKGE